MATVATNVASPIAIIDSFNVVDRGEVSDFLTARPYLISVLFEARERISRIFPVDTTVILDLARHPDPGSRPELVLRIVTPLPMSEGLARLDRLDEEWWLDALPHANGELTMVVWPA
jgi:hypothetical protein